MASTRSDCSRDDCLYGLLSYQPSLAGNVALLALFAVLVPIAVFLGVRYHSLVFTTTFITGILLEIIGYVGRVLLSQSDNGSRTDYVLSQLGTVLAPTVISLAIFRLMPPIVAAYGDQYRPWRPTWHNLVFYTFTATCLVLQAAGAVLSTVTSNLALNDIGIRLLVAGLAVHLSSLFIFLLLGFRFALAVRQRKGGWDQGMSAAHNTARFKSFLFGIGIATFLLVVRTMYRTVTVARDSSPIERSEILFLVLDGALVFVAAALLLGLFPGRMLDAAVSESTIQERRIAQKSVTAHRPPPIQLERTSYAPYHTRVSLKSGTTTSPYSYSPQTYQKLSPKDHASQTNTPKTSPRRSMIPPPSQRIMSDQRNPAEQRRNMVDAEQLW
ncbi:RTA1 like protein-domain-containing protein [Pestalotiopsis sp. NC0098]|nr:RTA1 like protein-domain-containing protein [Pestalotiopsis sp. NC0098]